MRKYHETWRWLTIVMRRWWWQHREFHDNFDWVGVLFFLIRVWFTPWQRMCLYGGVYGGRMVEVKDPEWGEWKFGHGVGWLMEECMGWTWCINENKENKITLSIITYRATSNHDNHQVPKMIPREPSFLQLFFFVFLNLSLGN